MGASRSPARQTDCRPGRPTALLSLCSLPLFLWAIARSLAPSPSRQNLTLNISVRVRLHSAAADATDASSFLAPSSTRLRPPPRRKEKEEKRVRSGQELAERSRVKRSPSSSPSPPSLRRLGQERRKTLDSGQWPVRCLVRTCERSFRPVPRTLDQPRARGGGGRPRDEPREREYPVSPAAAAVPPPLRTVSAKRLECCVQYRVDGCGRLAGTNGNADGHGRRQT